MEFKFQKRKGIGNVITTLIILIASVVLGAGVIFFGGSMFQTNTQSESIKVSNVHAWVGDGTSNSTTAFVVQNTGSKAVTINSVSLRGISVPNGNWDFLITSEQDIIQQELPADFDSGGARTVTLDGTATPFPGTSGPISLNQGQAAVVYLEDAGNLESIDSGNTYALQIQAGQATAVQQVSVVTET